MTTINWWATCPWCGKREKLPPEGGIVNDKCGRCKAAKASGCLCWVMEDMCPVHNEAGGG